MAIYYVDATNGDDSKDGQSEANAWKTIAKVNGSSFNAGDSILFKRGEEWREQLTVPSSGSSGNPITFGAYGSGADPIINGADIITGWVSTNSYDDSGALFKSHFETGDLTEWDSNSGNVSTDSNAKYIGNYGAKYTISAADAYLLEDNAFADQAEIYLRFYINFNSLSMANGEVFWIVRLQNDAGTDTARLQLYSDGTNYYLYLKIYDDGGSSYNLPGIGLDGWQCNSIIDQNWHYIEIHFKAGSGTDGIAEFWVDGTSRGSKTDLDSDAKRIGKIYLGAIGVDANTSATIYIDDVVIDTTSIGADPMVLWKKTNITTQPKIVIFDGTIGVYQTSQWNLSNTEEWHWDSNTLYVYSTSDPDTAYTSPGVEVGQRERNIYIPNLSYITIENLHLKGANGSGIYSYQSNHIDIQDITIESIGHFGMLIEKSYNITVDNVTAYYITIEEAIYITATNANDTHDITIENCYLHHFAENGIALNSTNADGVQNVTIKYNRIFHSVDTWNTGSLSGGGADSGNGIQMTNSKYVDIYYNLIKLPSTEGTVVDGIQVSTNVSEVNIYNNVIYGDFGPCAIRIKGDNVNFKNNIVQVDGGNYDQLVYVHSDASVTGISNNQYYYSSGNNTNAFYWKGTYYAYDQFSSWETASGDSNSSTGDPLFVDAANDNFALQGTSPCIDAGTDVSLTSDYNGSLVPMGDGTPDIGAVEYARFDSSVQTIASSIQVPNIGVGITLSPNVMSITTSLLSPIITADQNQALGQGMDLGLDLRI